MRKIVLFFICSYMIITQGHCYERRNPLQSQFSQNDVRKYIVMDQKWVSLPDYTNRAGWDILFDVHKDEVIQKGERFLDYDWHVITAKQYLAFIRNGDRRMFETTFYSNASALVNLFVAELAEGKGRFIDEIVNGIYTISETTSWANPAHLSNQVVKGNFPDHNDNVLDIVSTDVGALFSWIYYFLNKEFDKIHPLISKRIYDNVERRIMKPYLEEDRFWWMGIRMDEEKAFVNNWNPWCTTSALQCFLLLENDINIVTRAVYKSMVSIDKYFNYIKEDGACEEGPSYWGSAAGRVYDYLQILNDATDGNINIFSNKLLKDMGEFISRSYIGDGWVTNFADAHAKQKPEYHLIYNYGKAVQSQEMINFSAYLYNIDKPSIGFSRHIIGGFNALKAELELKNITANHKTESQTWYPQTEFCFVREDNLFFAAKGGHNNESHNHNDIGSFILFHDNNPIFIDAGVGTYTKQTFDSGRYSLWYMQSDYHNLPVINGFSQPPGGQYKATNAKFNKNTNTFSLDISNAYPKEACVKAWNRTYKISKKGATIKEQFEIDNPTTANVINFLTPIPPELSKSGVITLSTEGKKATISYDKDKFNVELDIINVEDSRLTNIWGEKLYRLQLKAKKIEAKGTYNFTIHIN